MTDRERHADSRSVQAVGGLLGPVERWAVEKTTGINFNISNDPTETIKGNRLALGYDKSKPQQASSSISSSSNNNNVNAPITNSKTVKSTVGEIILPEKTSLGIIRDTKTGRVKGVEHTQRHHIVHQKLQNHPLWEAAGLDCDHSINTMLLPTKKGAEISTTTRSIHQGRHFKEIERNLEIQMNRVLKAGQQNNFTKEQYKQELIDIIRKERQQLKSGDRALNKNARPWATRLEKK